jgi:polyferredoxin
MDAAAHHLTGRALPEPSVSWSAGRDEAILLLLYAAAVACSLLKLRKARLPILIISFLFLGLMMKRPVSLSNIAALLMGHAPSAEENLFWWLLVPGSLALVIALGKNVYCTWLCPFGAIQELISRTGGLQTPVSRPLQRGLKAAARAVTWVALMIAFGTGNAAHAAIEPFATFFGLKGTPIQWYLVSLVLVGAFFIPRFWCRFFCPAGICFKTASGLRRSITRRFAGKPQENREKHAISSD